MFDGKPLPLQWTSVSNWGYSYVAFTVSHGPHIVSVADGSSALFGVYAYGHSAIDTSTSAYGYAVGFEGMLYTGVVLGVLKCDRIAPSNLLLSFLDQSDMMEQGTTSRTWSVVVRGLIQIIWIPKRHT